MKREVFLYLVFGGFAFVISVASYAVANLLFGINELIANVISWILAVLFAYFTNRTWVFHGNKSLLKEFAEFTSGRIGTVIVEELILLVFITWLGFDSITIKVVAQIVVIVLNYLISKFWVFKSKP